jgi:prolyl oligopeptidase
MLFDRMSIGPALVGLLLGLAGLAAAAAPATPGAPRAYPPARRGAQMDEYHGVKVADPYRWMEDIDSAETRAWVAAENALSRRYLDAVPGRAQLVARLREIWNFEVWTPPERHGANWFYTHNDGLQNQAVVFVTADASNSGRVLLDPNTLSSDGTVALRDSTISNDGRLFAYALSDAGSDWQVWHVRNVDSGKDLPDTLKWSKAGSASWRKDGSGFYYTAYDRPAAGAALKSANQYEKLNFHRLGTPQSQDAMIYTRKDAPNWYVSGTVTDDGHYLIIEANLGTDERNTVLVQDLTQADAPIVPIVAVANAAYDVIGNVGTMLLVRTDDGASRYRIVGIDIENPDPGHWRSIVPEGADTLDAASFVGGQLIANCLKDAHSAVRRYTVEGRPLGTVGLAGIGTAEGFGGRVDSTQTYFSFSGFSTPPSIYRLDLADGKVGLWHAPRLKGFEGADYETQQVFYKSKDGTAIPMFITARKGTALDGNNPTILYGYGGFNVSYTPTFTPAVAEWLRMGGVYAVANLRGGGEYGRAWHEAGMKTLKQNVFDDFIAAGDYLSAAHWTNPRRLAIKGRSNGGLLIGAVEEQRPDLAAVAIAQVGVMDMLRFNQFTVGKGWEADYGSVDDPEIFRAVRAYSPYHNVRAGVNYPATLITTGDHDDRVFPAHSFKFAAAMQNADPQGQPILLRVETRAGHAQGEPVGKLIDEVADIYAFILQNFGLAH